MKLGDCVTLIRGTTYKSSLLSESDGPVLRGLGSIERHGGFKKGAWKHYPGSSSPDIILHPGDLYVSLKDLTQACDLLGAVARVPKYLTEGRLTQDTVKLHFQNNASEQVRQYVYWSLRSPQYRAYCKARGTGTTNMSLSRKDFLDWEIPTKTKGRDTLVQLLELIELKLALNSRLNDHLAEMAMMLFDSECPQANEPNAVLSDVAEITMGQSPSGSSYNENGHGEVFYQGRGEFGSFFPRRHLFTTEPKRMAREGDILVSVRAPVGDLNIAAEDCCIGRGLAAIHSGSNQSFVHYLMRAQKRQLDTFNGDGTVFGSINGKALKELSVYLPSNDGIAHLQSLLEPIDAMIRRNDDEMQALEQLRDALLPKLMSGEIDISRIDLWQLNGHLSEN